METDFEILSKAGKIIALKKIGKEESVILFEDGETFMKFSEQDYYCYHDCSSSAREIYVYKDKSEWNFLYSEEDKKYIY